MIIRAWCDGSSLKGGGAGAGVSLKVMHNGKEVRKHILAWPLDRDATNNEAEYQAILLAVQTAIDLARDWNDEYPLICKIYTDSELAVKQISGDYRVKNENLKRIHARIVELMDGYNIEVAHIPREENEQADALSRSAALLSAAKSS
jgi:ribonuclease HI